MFDFDIIGMLMVLPGIIIGISFHEFAHALAAVKLGDNTPRFQGRLTLDPTKHLDPIGFLCLLFFHFGWAKPVMINPRNFKNPRRDDIIVSLAGPLMNLILAICFMILLKLLIVFPPSIILTNKTSYILSEMLNNTVIINLVLMIFNLIPIPPLDGHHILGNIIGPKATNFYYQYAGQIRIILLILIFTGMISKIIWPPVYFIYNLLIGLFF